MRNDYSQSLIIWHLKQFEYCSLYLKIFLQIYIFVILKVYSTWFKSEWLRIQNYTLLLVF